ncbi:MAG TPA: FHA domain-containing protein [Kofleriaceae bacterium]
MASLVVALFMSPRAHAEGAQNTEVYLQVKPQEPGSKTEHDAPMIEATIINGPNPGMDKITLTEPASKPPQIVKAMAVKGFVAGNEPIAIALVINGQETWIGNDDIEPEDSSERYPGILKPLKAALQTVPFSTAGPASSKGMLMTYADRPEIKIPMGPLSAINAEALGTQKDYYRKIGTSMVQAINQAIGELKNVSANRKALIVVCDGNDTNPEAAKTELANLKKEAAAAKIEIFEIIYKGPLSTPENLMSGMTSNISTATNAEAVGSSVDAILKRLADRYYVTFPGYDPKTKQGFQWDGKSHDLVVKIEKDEFSPEAPLTLSPTWNLPKKPFPWWIVVVAVVGGLLLLIILVKVLGGAKEAPAPMPMPVMAAPMPEAPKPAGPMKTVMIGVGGGEDGFPIVGWLVPLNGQNAYQTYRLRSGGTKIGTQAPSDIVVNDGFMSTDHCQINCSPAGFTLVDNGSTNGVYVNDRKISKHDLVDNDMVTLGKTNFKFKSIN